jgi:Asp-tRNA(Asn)/Glu-tRNA(Gln) amidotransferase A subunit family amidase
MIELDAATIAREVTAGRLDPVAIVDAFGARIAELNGTLNALVGYAPAPAKAKPVSACRSPAFLWSSRTTSGSRVTASAKALACSRTFAHRRMP